MFCVGRARSNHLRSPITAQDVGGGRRCLASASRIRVSRIAARHGLTYIQRLITDATGVVDTINPPERLVDGEIRNCIPLKYILCHLYFYVVNSRMYMDGIHICIYIFSKCVRLEDIFTKNFHLFRGLIFFDSCQYV